MGLGTVHLLESAPLPSWCFSTVPCPAIPHEAAAGLCNSSRAEKELPPSAPLAGRQPQPTGPSASLVLLLVFQNAFLPTMPEDLLAQAQRWKGLEGVHWYGEYWCLGRGRAPLSLEGQPLVIPDLGLDLDSAGFC